MKSQIRTLILACTMLFLCVLQTAKAQVIKLNSYPTAAPVIFLDFDGQYVSGTSWNWGGPIHAAGSGFSNTAVEEIFNRVAEDYRPFNINVTTDSTVFFSAPLRQRIRVIITPTSAWYGNTGGAAWVGSFNWGDDTPCFVFCNKLGYSAKNVAEACSHESGHTFGMQHQSTFDAACNQVEEYNSGKGTGEISWAPIMGNSYARNLTTWTKGTSAFGCSYIQDDIKLITSFANKITFRTDDVADVMENATPFTTSANAFANSGVLTRMDDKDVFKLTLNIPSVLRLTAVPYTTDNNSSGANLDLKVSMIAPNGDTLSKYDQPDKLSAAIDTFLPSGTYYFAVDGVGNSYLSDTSSIGFYTISGTFTPTGILPVKQTDFSGNNVLGEHRLQWKITTDEPLKKTELQVAKDGIHFETILNVGNQTQYRYTPYAPGSLHYRLKITASGSNQPWYSPTVVLSTDANTPVGKVQSIGNGQYRVSSFQPSQYSLLDASGRIMQQGSMKKGDTFLHLPGNGIYLLRVTDGMRHQTEKLIKH